MFPPAIGDKECAQVSAFLATDSPFRSTPEIKFPHQGDVILSFFFLLT